jgi:hypothetical protein
MTDHFAISEYNNIGLASTDRSIVVQRGIYLPALA